MCVIVYYSNNIQVLRLSQMTLSHVTIGHVINIASNDVHRFDEVSL